MNWDSRSGNERGTKHSTSNSPHTGEMMDSEKQWFQAHEDQISLCEALDRVLNKGAVIVGEVTISVADIDLIYLGLQAILSSVETARREHSINGVVDNKGKPDHVQR